MKNIVICANLENEAIGPIDKIQELYQLENCKVTLLYAWNNNAYSYQGDMIVPFYPNEEQSKEIEKGFKSRLEELYSSFPNLSKENLSTKIICSSNIKHSTAKFINETNADLVITLTTKKGGIENFFHSSFSNYLNSHTSCSVLAIKG